jgi:gluconolactonase
MGARGVLFMAANLNTQTEPRRCIFLLKAALALAAAALTACAPAMKSEVSGGNGPKGVGTLVRLDPAFDAIVSKDAIIEKVAGGFQFTEGPLWRSDGHLWFSDVTGNVVRSVTPDGQVKALIENAGGETSAPPGSFIGPNAMVADKDGYVLLCQHTNRRIARLDHDLKQTAYLDKFEGKRFNSPNDLVYKSDGALYFTDPPYGLLKQDDDPAKELKFNGVFRYANGKLTAVIKDLTRPNGIAFSPDEKYLYISNSDEKHKVWMKYDVNADGSVSNGKVFFDVTAETESGLPDGMKVDSLGNVYASGPGGTWVFSADGKHLGTIKSGEMTANCAWAEDGKTLYITASTGVYRIRLLVAGEKPLYQ